MEKIKIAVAGIGAVGGYFGGKLAHHYKGSSSVEVNFIARGENERMIREEGLLVESTSGNFRAFPEKVTSIPSEIGIMDYILICTKSYDLDQIINQLKPCIGEETVILPVMNGVDYYETITQLLPDNEVWMGCTYIVSRLTSPGVVRETGSISILKFGKSGGSAGKLQQMLSVFREAGVNAQLPENIEEAIWEKFFFISTVATATSYFDTNMGQLVENPEYRSFLNALFDEFKAIASAKGISLPDDITEKAVKVLQSVPPETTSSMHSDFKKGKRTEAESLTGYIVRSGKSLDVLTSAYEKAYSRLLSQ